MEDRRLIFVYERRMEDLLVAEMQKSIGKIECTDNPFPLVPHGERKTDKIIILWRQNLSNPRRHLPAERRSAAAACE